MEILLLVLSLLGDSAPRCTIQLVSPKELQHIGLGGMATNFQNPDHAGSVFNGEIYLSSNSTVYKRARRGDHDSLVMLASLIKHEEAHLLLGNCELLPYQIQLLAYDNLGGKDNAYRKAILSQIQYSEKYPCKDEASR